MAMPEGPLPTRIGGTARFVRGLISETESSSTFATQSDPWPVATDDGRLPSGMCSTSLLLTGSYTPTELPGTGAATVVGSEPDEVAPSANTGIATAAAST